METAAQFACLLTGIPQNGWFVLYQKLCLGLYLLRAGSILDCVSVFCKLAAGLPRRLGRLLALPLLAFLAQARRRLSSARKRLARIPERLQKAEQVIAAHQAKLDQLQAKRTALKEHLEKLRADNENNLFVANFVRFARPWLQRCQTW